MKTIAGAILMFASAVCVLAARCTPHVFLAKLSRWAKQNPCQAESIS